MRRWAPERARVAHTGLAVLLVLIDQTYKQIEKNSSLPRAPHDALPTPPAQRAALSQQTPQIMRLRVTLCLLAMAGGALALRPEPAAGADLRVGGAGQNNKDPWFCHNLQCPRFTVVNATDDYEVRGG